MSRGCLWPYPMERSVIGPSQKLRSRWRQSPVSVMCKRSWSGFRCGLTEAKERLLDAVGVLCPRSVSIWKFP